MKKEIEEKIQKGEELTAEETQEVMAEPVEPTEPGSESGAGDEGEAAPESTGIKKQDEADKKKPADKTPGESSPDSDDTAGKSKEKAPDEITADKKLEIQQEAEKPLSEADTSKYSDKERALFYELRKERRKRQQAQEERDVAKFQNLKKEITEKLQKEAPAEEEIDPLKDLNDDDVLTVAEMRAKLKAVKKPEKKEAPKDQGTHAALQRMQLNTWLLEARLEHADAIQVTDHAHQFLDGNKEAEEEIANAIHVGKNPVLVTYKILKNDPKYLEFEKAEKAKKEKKPDAEPEKGKEKKEDDETLRNRAERIEKNNKKTVTTGAAGGSAPAGEYSYQEILDMSEEEYANLSPEKRAGILKAL